MNHTVGYGPFRGMRLATESRWSAADRGSMLLGIYEQEILRVLERVSQGRRVLVDVGAADGYYAIGALRSSLFEYVVCFEIDPVGQRVIAQQADFNGVASRITILGEATENFLREARAAHDFDNNEVVVLMDIEGGEFDLLSDHIVEDLKDAVLIIELHDFEQIALSKAAELINRLEARFFVSVLTQQDRNPNAFEELCGWSDDDRWLLCSESRQKSMRWLVCEPK